MLTVFGLKIDDRLCAKVYTSLRVLARENDIGYDSIKRSASVDGYGMPARRFTSKGVRYTIFEFELVKIKGRGRKPA